MDKIRLKKILEQIVSDGNERVVQLAKNALDVLGVEDVPVLPIGERLWTLYRKDNTTSVLRLHKDGTVAVARAFLSENDNFCRQKGRSIAEARMKRLVTAYATSTGIRRMSIDPDTVYKKPEKYKNYAIFEIVQPNELQGEERSFFASKIQPKLKEMTA